MMLGDWQKVTNEYKVIRTANIKEHKELHKDIFCYRLPQGADDYEQYIEKFTKFNEKIELIQQENIKKISASLNISYNRLLEAISTNFENIDK